jgi:hypothetical protein
MRRHVSVAGVIALGLMACQPAEKQAPAAKTDSPAAAPAPAPAAAPITNPTTPEQKIASAMAAAPAGVSGGATIMDFPSTPAGKPAQLRAGTNGFTCMPDDPTTEGADPMCFDAQWSTWAEGYMAKKPPKVTAVGYAYMLQGDGGASNTEPFAKKAAPDNDWHVDGPHVMVIYPDQKQYAALGTDHKAGGPYVMWKGTPYQHVMLPIK